MQPSIIGITLASLLAATTPIFALPTPGQTQTEPVARSTLDERQTYYSAAQGVTPDAGSAIKERQTYYIAPQGISPEAVKSIKERQTF